MTTVLASPPARPLDVRVADSPLVGIRFHLDARMGDLMHALENVDRERAVSLERRARLLEQAGRNDRARTELLHSLERQSLVAVRRCLREGIEIAVELGRLEEHLRAVSAVQSALIQQSRVLREAVVQLSELTDPVEVELIGRASRFSQATRRVFQLAEAQHEEVERSLIEGPLQRLSEAVFDAEVAFRQAGDQPAAAQEMMARCRDATTAARADVATLIRRWRPLHRNVSLLGAVQTLLSDVPAPASARLLVLGSARPVRAATELAGYRIVEEALANAVRHGRASRVDVVVAYHRDRLVLLVKDDGDGFDVVATEARLGRSPGVGLISMRSRAVIAGGQFDIRSVIGAGAEVRATLPASDA